MRPLSRRQFLEVSLASSSLLLLPGCGGTAGTAPSTAGGGAPGGPRGVHVSFTGDPQTTRTVTWFTDGVVDPGTILEYGPAPAGKALESMTFASRITGSTQPTYGVEALTHRATMTGLDPSLPTAYRVGDGANWSPVRVLSPARPGVFRFVHFGDHGMTQHSHNTVQKILARNPDFFLIAGDLSYANGDQPVWDAYFDLLEPLAAAVPMMAAPGNHEDEDNGALGYKSRTSHPGHGTFYSFEYNRAHFLISTGGALIDDRTLPQELLNIELDLSQAALRRASGEIDFIIVVQHFTTWTDEEGRSPMNPSIVAAEEDIFVRYGIDLLLDGHDHEYQRSKPFAYGIPNPLGYVQVVAGNGGVGIRSFSGKQRWSAVQQLRYGFTEYEVDVGVIRVTTYATADKDGPILAVPEIMDQFELRARSLLARREAVQAVRLPEKLLANFDAIARHTRDRNRLHLRGAHRHV